MSAGLVPSEAVREKLFQASLLGLWKAVDISSLCACLCPDFPFLKGANYIGLRPIVMTSL